MSLADELIRLVTTRIRSFAHSRAPLPRYTPPLLPARFLETGDSVSRKGPFLAILTKHFPVVDHLQRDMCSNTFQALKFQTSEFPGLAPRKFTGFARPLGGTGAGACGGGVGEGEDGLGRQGQIFKPDKAT